MSSQAASAPVNADPHAAAAPVAADGLSESECTPRALRASGAAVSPVLSPNDDRAHAVFLLANGLRACVVSDPTAAKAACAVDVFVGHQSDGDVSGVAHFAEHLAFMGSDKFPVENDFATFLAQNGGGSNAFTSGQHTNYHCRVTPGQLRPALQRLSRFFIKPLFLEVRAEYSIFE